MQKQENRKEGIGLLQKELECCETTEVHAELLKSRREGKSVFYSLADTHVRTIIGQGREHIEE